jgi:hypothetical protein
MIEPISAKPTDWNHGQQVAGMRPERPQPAHYQVHEQPHPLRIGEGISRRLRGFVGTLRNLTESLNPEKQIPFGQISEIYLAHMLAGQWKKDYPPQTKQFSRAHAFASLGYHSISEHPLEYAAMLFAQDALEEDGVLGKLNDSTGQQEPQLIVIDSYKLAKVLYKDPADDVSLSRVFMLGTDQDQNAVVQRIIREHEKAA